MMSPEEQEELIQLRKTKEEYIGVFPQLEFFNENRGYYSSMPFIPQDMGFEHMNLKPRGSRVMDVYHRDGISATKIDSGEWIIQKGEERLPFIIKNKFEAYIILRALGVVFDAPNPNEDPDL